MPGPYASPMRVAQPFAGGRDAGGTGLSNRIWPAAELLSTTPENPGVIPRFSYNCPVLSVQNCTLSLLRKREDLDRRRLRSGVPGALRRYMACCIAFAPRNFYDVTQRT